MFILIPDTMDYDMILNTQIVEKYVNFISVEEKIGGEHILIAILS